MGAIIGPEPDADRSFITYLEAYYGRRPHSGSEAFHHDCRQDRRVPITEMARPDHHAVDGRVDLLQRALCDVNLHFGSPA